jgi:hypothetical protein
VCLICGGHAPVARMAAGATWRLVIASAPWAVRRSHTSVVDAAGAIYVLGGCIYEGSTNTFYNDVWASTDGGARPDSRRVGTQMGTQRVLNGYSPGTHGLLTAAEGYSQGVRLAYAVELYAIPSDPKSHSRGTQWVLSAILRVGGTHWVLMGFRVSINVPNSCSAG